MYPGGMELSDIRTVIRTRAGINAADENATDTVLDTLINEAIRQITNIMDWSWLEASETGTTVAGVDTIVPTATARKMRWVRVNNREIRYSGYRDRVLWSGRTGFPQNYTEDAGAFRWLPAPSDAFDYEIGYSLTADTYLVDDTDEPLLPDYAIPVLVAKVAAMYYRRTRDREQEQLWYSEFRQELDNIKDDQVKTTEGVTPRRSWNY